MAEEEDVRMEVEAVQAVYGDDCWVVDEFPPHLNLHIKPRTADDSSQQFVEVTIGIKSSAQYPNETPHVYIVEEKGLDEKRQTHLITSILNKASELSSCLMLVALCEEAVETLSNMNHPDGDCPLCLYPLVTEVSCGTSQSFMKLMSCYHCFHCDCIRRLWKWVHEQNGSEEMNTAGDVSAGSTGTHNGTLTGGNQHKGNCPVCRKVFDAKDIEHVLDYLGADSSHLSCSEADAEEDVKAFLQSNPEMDRKQKFEAVLRLQKENNGLIEPRKDLAIVPGMYLPETPTAAAIPAEPSANPPDSAAELNPLNRAAASKPKSTAPRRKPRVHGSQRQPHAQFSRQQWVKKENAPER